MPEFPWGDVEWTERAIIAASFIPPKATVLELGSGMGKFRKRIDPLIYVPVDKEKWTPDTLTCDLNGRLPNLGYFDFVVALGLVEYLYDPLSFFEGVHQMTNSFVLSYRRYTPAHEIHGRVSRHNLKNIQELLIRADWIVVKKQRAIAGESVWLLKSKKQKCLPQ